MNQRMLAEAVQQTTHVVHRELAFASVNQLHSAPVLQVDARNHHI